MVTFGQKYRHEEHPVLPRWAVNPDGWLEVVAEDRKAAVTLLAEFGGDYSMLYEEEIWSGHWFPHGCVGVITTGGLEKK